MLSENSYFKITLSRIATVILTVIIASFTVGMAWGVTAQDQGQLTKNSTKINESEKQLIKVATILTRIEKNQEDQSADITDLKEKMHSIDTEIKIIAEKVNSANK